MKTIVLASRNPVKEAATLGGFRRMFPDEAFRVESVSVSSGVSDQPMSDAETLAGAENRARNAAFEVPEADYWLGLEGGIEDSEREMWCFAWVVVRGAGREGSSRTATFLLPERIAVLVRQGVEVGAADDRVFGRTNSKHQDGAIGILTSGAIDRRELYEPAVVSALIPFRNPELF